MDLVRFRYGENNINTGPLKEIPEICIDHFFGSDLNSCVFLLSHAHTDHLVGLETEAFIRRLRQPGVKLYCHPLTPILLGSFERYLNGPTGIRQLISERKIVPLDVEKPKLIKIPRLTGGHLDVTLTLLPAGHCPGSVMFLFETASTRILHTGDFRLCIDDLKRMPLLHKKKQPKPIDHLYIDTTFCTTAANLFPDRKRVLKEALDNISDWIRHSKKHVVMLSFSAKFAHEYVLLEINRKFGQKIHVVPERLEIYRHIPEIYDIVTLDKNTQFHLCGNRYCLEDVNLMTMRLSSMWYTKQKETHRDSFISWRGPNNMTLCYSMHSSLGEIAQTIDYLQPKVVTPLVLPIKSDISQIQTAIRSVATSPFDFEDYRSSRNDFKDITLPKVPCIEERDETDDVNIDSDDEVPENAQIAEECLITYEEDIPAKRLKLSSEESKMWQFKFSPSPSSQNSQSSSDGSQNTSDGSQEANSQNLRDNFTKPSLPPVAAARRRNLSLADFSTNLNDKTQDEGNCEHLNESNDDDTSINSQRL